MKDLEQEVVARYADFQKKDQSAFDAEEANKKKATAHDRLLEKVKYETRDLLKADPVLGNWQVNQAVRKSLDEWIKIETLAREKRQDARQSAMRVDEIKTIIDVKKISQGMI